MSRVLTNSWGAGYSLSGRFPSFLMLILVIVNGQLEKVVIGTCSEN